jgi:hypothetical protein
LSPSSAAYCFLKGAAAGAAGDVVVGALAVGAVTLGAPVVAVTRVLGVVAAAGGIALGIDVIGSIRNGNWDGLAFNLGSLAGSSVVGGIGGRALAEGINGVPSPPWSPASDWGQRYNPNLGSQLHRAIIAQQRVRMEGWRQRRLGFNGNDLEKEEKEEKEEERNREKNQRKALTLAGLLMEGVSQPLQRPTTGGKGIYRHLFVPTSAAERRT